MTNVIQRASLGQTGLLGNLYDAAVDDFERYSLYNFSSKEQRHPIDPEMTWIVDDDYSSKFSLLHVPSDQQASFLVGLLSGNVKGSGKLLEDNKMGERTVRSVLKITIQTKTETVDDLNSSVNLQLLSKTENLNTQSPSGIIATHFVSQVLWGANLILVFDYKNDENEDTKKVTTMLQSFLQELLPNTQVPVSEVGAIKKLMSKYSLNYNDIVVRIYRDVGGNIDRLQNQPLSIPTILGIITLIEQFPTIVLHSYRNGVCGIGIPLAYSLTPISSLELLKPLVKTSTCEIHFLGEESLPLITKMVSIFQNISTVKQKFDDLNLETKEMQKNFIKVPDENSVQTLTAEFEEYRQRISANFCTALFSVRRGISKAQVFADVMSRYEASNENDISSIDHFSSFIDSNFGADLNKMKFIRQLVAQNVRVVRDDELDEVVRTSSASTNNSVVVLFYKTPEILTTSDGNVDQNDNFDLNCNFFHTCLKEKFATETVGAFDSGMTNSHNVLFKLNLGTPINVAFSVSPQQIRSHDVIHDLQNIPNEEISEMFELNRANEFYAITIMGKMEKTCDRFCIELLSEDEDDSLLKYSSSFNDNRVTISSAQNGCWSEEETHNLQVQVNEIFNMKIFRDSDGFKIIVAGKPEINYQHNFEFNSSNMKLKLSGDLTIFLLKVDLQSENKNSGIFQGFAFVDKKSEYILVDRDMATEKSNSTTVPHTSIFVYENCKAVSKNLLQDSIAFLSKRIAKSIKPLTRNHGGENAKPRKRTYAAISCPGSFPNHAVGSDPSPPVCHCGGSKGVWLCWKCQDRLEYGFDNHFYCSCGKGRITDFRFRCDGETKDAAARSFLKFENETQLNSQLNALEPFKQMNILLLGETGVGKSTWINGFANYLTYDSLEEASENEIMALIPSSFTLINFNENFEKVQVTVGEDANEVLVAGQSATQQSTSYTFVAGNTLIQIIDTPGIGDVRGLTQDKENFQNIMQHISHIDQINGICILLKPNESRISIVFEFCIKQLLTHLHRDAAQNIVFCFTNARGTFYKPGDTYASLDSLLSSQPVMSSLIKLKKDTVYCMDNEAFRFLAAVKNGVSFEEEEKKNFSGSWLKSVNETRRLLQHFTTLKPHGTKSTVSLNSTRQIILKLARPIAEMSQNIQTNIAVLRDREVDLQSSKERYSDLKSKLYVPQVDLDIIPLNYPKTVCGSPACTERLELYSAKDFSKVYKTYYKQICHSRCTIKGVATNQLHCVELQGCACMGEGVGTAKARCKMCGCSWETHLHITYDTKQKMVEVINKNVESDMKTTESRRSQIQGIIQKCQERIKKYEEEQKHITMSSATFAVFLKNNAITPYNDALVRFLDHQIALEEEKIQNDGNVETLKGLRSIKQTYLAEIDILESAIKRSAGEFVDVGLTPGDIQKSLEHLYQLPLSGKKIRELVETAEHADKFCFREKIFKSKFKFMKRVSVPWRHYSGDGNHGDDVFVKLFGRNFVQNMSRGFHCE